MHKRAILSIQIKIQSKVLVSKNRWLQLSLFLFVGNSNAQFEYYFKETNNKNSAIRNQLGISKLLIQCIEV